MVHIRMLRWGMRARIRVLKLVPRFSSIMGLEVTVLSHVPDVAHTIRVDDWRESVSDLKKKIEKSLGIETRFQRLTYAAKPLRDGKCPRDSPLIDRENSPRLRYSKELYGVSDDSRGRRERYLSMYI
jgi:Ubiquitin family